MKNVNSKPTENSTSAETEKKVTNSPQQTANIAVTKNAPQAPSKEQAKAQPKEQPKEKVSQADLALLNDLNAALQHETHHRSFAVIILFFIFAITFLVWAYNSPLEEVTRGQGSVIPSQRDQIVQSIDPGIIQEMRVKEGDIVEKGQVLLVLDDTRSSAILRESQAKVHNLQAVATRLRAEAYGKKQDFSDDIPEELKQREIAVYDAKQKTLNEAVESLTQSKKVLDREIAITQPMVDKGVMSEIELLRLKRQSLELGQQITERTNKYRSDASHELVQVESELAQALENMAVRADPVERSQLRAPLKGVVKNIRINTVGGVVQAGQDILEIVPLDDKLVVQAYISPKDVAFIRTGQEAIVKISAYDYAIYGGIEGKVVLISPDTLQDERRPSELKLNADQAYYRVLVETTKNNITDKTGKVLEITPGMTATVDIKTGEKTVFQYLIKPITRMKQALQER